MTIENTNDVEAVFSLIDLISNPRKAKAALSKLVVLRNELALERSNVEVRIKDAEDAEAAAVAAADAAREAYEDIARKREELKSEEERLVAAEDNFLKMKAEFDAMRRAAAVNLESVVASLRTP